jgi:hypothetical protein
MHVSTIVVIRACDQCHQKSADDDQGHLTFSSGLATGKDAVGSFRAVRCCDHEYPQPINGLLLVLRRKAQAGALGLVKQFGKILCGFRSNLVKNLSCLVNLRNTKNHDRRVRPRLDADIGVIDIDFRFTEFRRRAR